MVAHPEDAALGRVERVMELDATPDAVWNGVAAPVGLATWLACELELEVRPGARGLARRADGAVRRIRVEALEPPRRLAFRWWPYEEFGFRPAGRGTRVEITVDARG